MLRLFYVLLLFLFSHQALAWDEHAVLTKIVLNDWNETNQSISSYLNRPVRAETLQAFLQATQSTLPDKLVEIEQWARLNEQGYRPIPDALLYQPLRTDCSSDLETCFKKSIRINLDVPLPLVVYDPQHQYAGGQQGGVGVTSTNQLLPSYIPLTFNLMNFTLLAMDEQVKLADVITTASMQPDFGMDTFLYENSGTQFGQLYGFGMQPLGNPALPFHSQMLFHMSSYHEDFRILALVPRLNEDYPEYRAFLYMNLSRFAAETNHPYWSAVFLGWGLHYIQDLTQPYDTRIAYGLDVNVVLQAFAEIAKNNYIPFIQLQTIEANRHVILENLADFIMTSPVHSSVYNNFYRKSLARALTDRQADVNLPMCDLNSLYMRQQMSQNEIADYQILLQATIPSYYVNSPQFHADDLKDYNGLFWNEMNNSQRIQFTQSMAQAFGKFGAYTRACLAHYAGL